MKINVNQLLRKLDGIPLNSQKECVIIDQAGNFIKDNQDRELIKIVKTDDPFTLKQACVDALLMNTQDEKKISGTDKMKRFELSIKLYKGGSIDLKSEEITLLKELIGENYGSLIVGQVYLLLENKKSPMKSDTDKVD